MTNTERRAAHPVAYWIAILDLEALALQDCPMDGVESADLDDAEKAIGALAAALDAAWLAIAGVEGADYRDVRRAIDALESAYARLTSPTATP